MQKPVQQADGRGVLGQEPAPLIEGPVGADAQGAPFVGGDDEPEQQLCAGAGERREADLVDDDEVVTLNISIEVISRLTSWLFSPAASLPIPPGALRRLEPAERTALLEAMISTLTDPGMTAAIADLADVDPILVPPPRNLHVVSGQEIAGFLPPPPPIPGATGSRGAHLRADPILALSDPEDRAIQARRWLCPIAADAGLTGIEHLTKR
jgi:hypothetical protein